VGRKEEWKYLANGSLPLKGGATCASEKKGGVLRLKNGCMLFGHWVRPGIRSGGRRAAREYLKRKKQRTRKKRGLKRLPPASSRGERGGGEGGSKEGGGVVRTCEKTRKSLPQGEPLEKGGAKHID